MIERKRRGRLVSARREVAEQNRIRNSYERRLVGQLTVLFENIAETTVREYQVGGTSTVRFENVTNRISEVLVPHYRSIILAMAERFQTIKTKQDYEQIVRNYMRDTATSRIVGISNTTQNLIRSALVEADEAATNPKEAAKLIQGRVGGAFGRRRATTIARTETHAAASFANHEVAKTQNVPMRKQWVATNDGRTRTWHGSINGQQVDLDEDFIVPYKGVEYRMKHTGDPNGGVHNTINCRCVTIYLEAEDVMLDDQPKAPPVKIPDDKPFTDVGPLVQELSRGSAGAEAFTKKLNDALTPLTATVASRLPKPTLIIESKKGGWQDRGQIKSHLREGTLEHEYGHHIDAELGSIVSRGEYWSANGLRKAWNEDRDANRLKQTAERDVPLQRWKDELFDVEDYMVRGKSRRRNVPKFEGATEVSDIIDSMVGGYFRNRYHTWGHSISYWRRGGLKQMETFANLYSLQNKPQALAFVMKNFPRLQEEFVRAMQEFVDTGAIT
jgi:hypothetical protein